MLYKCSTTYAICLALASVISLQGDDCLIVTPNCYPVAPTCSSKIISKLCERGDNTSLKLAQQILQNTNANELFSLIAAITQNECLGAMLANIASEGPSALLNNFVASLFNPLFDRSRTAPLLSKALEATCNLQPCGSTENPPLSTLVDALMSSPEFDSHFIASALCDMTKRCVQAHCLFSIIELVYCNSIYDPARPENTVFGEVIRCFVRCAVLEKCIGFDGTARLLADFLVFDPASFRPMAQALATGNCCTTTDQEPCIAVDLVAPLAQAVIIAEYRWRTYGVVANNKAINPPTRGLFAGCHCCQNGQWNCLCSCDCLGDVGGCRGNDKYETCC